MKRPEKVEGIAPGDDDNLDSGATFLGFLPNLGSSWDFYFLLGASLYDIFFNFLLTDFFIAIGS